MIICRDVGFVHIAKNAGTSIRSALFLSGQCYYLGKVINPRADIKHKDNHFNAHFNPSEVTHQIDNLWLFTCVRNPWERLVSWYSWKKDTKSFREFVRQLYKVDPEAKSERNPRIPQNNPIQGSYFEGVSYDFVMRFESLDEDWKTVQEKLNTSVKLPVTNTSSHPHYRKYPWTIDLIELVCDKERYVIDTFGYKF
jgi:hypothetical protein